MRRRLSKLKCRLTSLQMSPFLPLFECSSELIAFSKKNWTQTCINIQKGTNVKTAFEFTQQPSQFLKYTFLLENQELKSEQKWYLYLSRFHSYDISYSLSFQFLMAFAGLGLESN